MAEKVKLAILGAGNIGRAMAIGLDASGTIKREQMVLTRRHLERLEDLTELGFAAQTDNRDAVRRAEIVVIAVEPQQLNDLLHEIGSELDPGRHLLISVVSGAGIDDMLRHAGKSLPVVRAMPNTGIAIGQSMTCLATNSRHQPVLDQAVQIFDAVGKTLVIDEDLMLPATALCACGIAFFLRTVRAASQGGIEIGFHPADALMMAAQTALGAASLVLARGNHPEREIDAVTTPRGCTIAGLNEMEHQGLSSALIKGIVLSANKAASLYVSEVD
ncbi:MAG: pyrroline-5-carboxylate reductase [Acidobacteriota bacterium]|nr:MAG: pyrroline-5-carboxylate reductase [Acidobacteriota bacterium]